MTSIANSDIPPELNFKKGQKLVCVAGRTSSGLLTDGKIYEALEDTEPGIFKDRPFIVVTNDCGKRLSCHASRFKPFEGEAQ